MESFACRLSASGSDTGKVFSAAGRIWYCILLLLQHHMRGKTATHPAVLSEDEVGTWEGGVFPSPRR